MLISEPMSWKLFIIIMQLFGTMMGVGMYLTMAAYIFRDWKLAPAEYGLSMRFTVGSTLIVVALIIMFGKG